MTLFSIPKQAVFLYPTKNIAKSKKKFDRLHNLWETIVSEI